MAPINRKKSTIESSPYELILHKLNEIYDSLNEAYKYKTAEISQLKNDLKKLQEMISNQNQTLLKIHSDSLETSKTYSMEIQDLKKEVKTFQDKSANQNQIIVELLSEIKVVVKSNLYPGIQQNKYENLFPISTQAELEAIEEEINEETKGAMIATIKFILGNGELQKTLKHLIEIPLLLEYNVFGLQGKKRLLNYERFMKAIYRAVGSGYGNKTDFFKHLSKCVRLVKNLHYKNKSIKQKNTSILPSDSE